jgi:hypothetical protein
LNDILETLPKNISNIEKIDFDNFNTNYPIDSNNICYEVRVNVSGRIFELGTVLVYHKDSNLPRGYDFI